jgi:hypothetical protein
MSYLSNANWSPVRPGVFFTTKMDGTLDVWDFIFKQNDPILNIQVGTKSRFVFHVLLFLSRALTSSNTFLNFRFAMSRCIVCAYKNKDVMLHVVHSRAL